MDALVSIRAELPRFAGRLARSRRGATISEYAIVAMLLLGAAGAAQSPRLHDAREEQQAAAPVQNEAPAFTRRRRRWAWQSPHPPIPSNP